MIRVMERRKPIQSFSPSRGLPGDLGGRPSCAGEWSSATEGLSSFFNLPARYLTDECIASHLRALVLCTSYHIGKNVLI